MRIALLVSFVLLGCAAGDNSRDPAYGGFRKVDVERLRAVNQMQVVNNEARQWKFGSAGNEIEAAASTKAEALGKMMEFCKSAGHIPENDMDGGKYTETIANGVGTCPITWVRSRVYTTAIERYQIVDNFEARHSDYVAESGIYHRRILGGYEADDEGTGRRIEGSFEVNYKTLEFGQINGTIETKQFYPIFDRGEGYASITLQIAGEYLGGSIHWNVESGVTKFYANGNEIGRKEFDDLFSGWELTKIMENSEKMR